MGKHNKLNQYQIDQMRAMKKDGKTNAEISEITGIKYRTVKQHCTGFYDPPEPFTDKELEDMKQLRAAGNILKTIASKYRCSIWRIKDALKTEASEKDGEEILNYATYGDAFIYS